MISLVGDIGGTNARFALTDGSDGLYHPRALPLAQFAGPREAIESYLESVAQSADHFQRPDTALLAIATPISGDRVVMTNAHWDFSIAETRTQLGLAQLNFINDFTGMAASLPLLEPGQLQQIGGREPIRHGVKGLLGAGTGLGVSGLVHHTDGLWQPLQGEGGHTTLGASNPRDFAIIGALSRRFGHVSYERVLSGPGLINTYQAIATVDGVAPESLQPAEITGRALVGADARCVETVNLFCRLLGQRAGDLALTLGAVGGIYVGGGIAPRLGDFLLRSGFREAFDNKGRLAVFVEPIPVYVITAEFATLTGVAAMIDR